MYGDTGVMRRRAAQLREQGVDIRSMADQLVARTEGVAWTGRAADTMRQRVLDRAAQLREGATHHDTAADSLERHLHEVDTLKDAIATVERKASTLVSDGPGQTAQVVRGAAQDDPAGVRRTATPEDEQPAAFTPPPPGHQDWLTVDLPGG